MILTEKTDLRRVYDDHAIGDAVFKKVLVSAHTDDAGRLFTACTAVHCQDFERRIGGVRFVRESFRDLDEVAYLADAMTWKTALCRLPVDGEKTVVYCHGLELEELEKAEKAEVLAAHLRILRTVDPGVIFGPDMHCDETVMDALAHDHDLGEHVAGLTEERGGFSIDEHGFTARGLRAALLTMADPLDWKLSTKTASVEGFGAVGAHTARLLSEHGVRVVAASISNAALYAKDGLPVNRLFDGWQREKDKAFKAFHENPPRGVKRGEQNRVFEVQADIFVPAARPNCLMTSKEIEEKLKKGERCEAEKVEIFLDKTGVQAVLEGANHPVSKEAEAYLLAHDVHILPDYLINGGGLIGCWVDWCHRQELSAGSEEVRNNLRKKAIDYIDAITTANVLRAMQKARDASINLREATNELARDAKKDILQELRGVAGQRLRAAAYLDGQLRQIDL